MNWIHGHMYSRNIRKYILSPHQANFKKSLKSQIEPLKTLSDHPEILNKFSERKSHPVMIHDFIGARCRYFNEPKLTRSVPREI